MHRSIAILALALAAPGLASAAKPYEVVRTGDSQMSCEQLSAETASLNGALQASQQESAKRESRSRIAKGMLGGMASAAPSLLGSKLGGGMMTQYALSGALQGMQGAAVGSPAVIAPPPEQQRLDHISALSRAAGC